MSCKARYGFSSRCHLPAGHTGPHHNGSFEFTDLDAEKSLAAIAKQIRGRD